MGRSTHGMPRTSWHLAQRPYEGFRRQVAVRADLGARPDGRADGCAGGSRHVLTVNTARGRAPRVVGPSGAAGGVVLCPPARGRGEVQPRGVLAPSSRLCAAPPHVHGGADPPRAGVGMGDNGGGSGGRRQLAHSANTDMARHRRRRGGGRPFEGPPTFWIYRSRWVTFLSGVGPNAHNFTTTSGRIWGV